MAGAVVSAALAVLGWSCPLNMQRRYRGGSGLSARSRLIPASKVHLRPWLSGDAALFLCDGMLEGGGSRQRGPRGSLLKSAVELAQGVSPKARPA